MSIIQNFTKKIAAVAVAAAALSAATAAVEARPLDVIKQSGEVVIGVFSDKAPFGYVDSQGKYAGYDVYFGDRLAKDLGVKVKYISVDPASRVEFLVTDKVDIILANFTVTKDRAEKVDFALPYMKVALGVVSPESAVITDVKQLDGKTLIIAKGTTAEPYFEKNHPKVKLQKYDQYTDAYNALLDGRGDAFSTDNTEVLAWAKSNKGFKVGITELLDRVLDSDERTFGDQRPQDPGPAPAAVPATSSRAAQDIDDDYDDYFDDFSAYNERTRR